MKASAMMDDRAFQAALEEYVVATSRDTATALNGKSRDLHYLSAKHTVKANAASIRALASHPRWYKIVAASFRGQSYTQEEAQQRSRKIIGKRVRSISYLKAGFAAAGLKHPAIANKAGKIRKPQAAAKVNRLPVKAVVLKAKPKRQQITSYVSWGSDNESDKKEKERIAFKGLRIAKPKITKDIQKYLRGKNRRNAGKVSA